MAAAGGAPPRVVLHRPLYAGNVGSSARAMANMGLRDLRLVGPRFDSDRQARMMATGDSEALLDAASRHDTLEEAVRGCTVVLGLTARPRTWKAWACLDPAPAADLLAARVAEGDEVALLFGAEDNGLEQEDLVWATHLCHIPTAPEHSSLNLSQAVLLMGWEWAQAWGRVARRPRKTRKRVPAPVDQVAGAADQIGALLDTIDFWRGRNRDQGLATARQALLRGEMTDAEIHFLRGVVNKLQWYVDFGPRLSDAERAARAEQRREQTRS